MRFAKYCCLSALLLAGCARVNTSTAIHADGSFTRKVVYAVSKMTGMAPPSDAKAKDKPEDYFKLPTQGPGVTVVRGEDKNGPTVTVTREVAADSAPLTDISLWGAKGKVMATSTVAVRKLDGGLIEYVETLHSLDPQGKSKQFVIPELRAMVKKALPAEFQTTVTIDKVTLAISINLVHAIAGPPEPLLMNLFVNPDSTIRRINTVAFTANVQTFKELIPSLTDAQSAAMARSLANILNQDTFSQTNAAADASGPKESSGDNEMSPLFFAVSFPGKVVSTNGLTDLVTGEVYWSLLPAALDSGDVQLRVVVKQ